MASNLIKVSTEDMEACIARYSSEKAKLMNALQICNQASQLLMQSWAGPSFLITCAKMADTYKNLFQSEQKMDDAISELRSTIQTMTGAENAVQKEAAALDVGTSPFA